MGVPPFLLYDLCPIDTTYSSSLVSFQYHLVSYGLPWNEALKGLTKNIANVFKLGKRGSIQEGDIADLVIWDGDPLEVSSFVVMYFIF